MKLENHFDSLYKLEKLYFYKDTKIYEKQNKFKYKIDEHDLVNDYNNNKNKKKYFNYTVITSEFVQEHYEGEESKQFYYSKGVLKIK